MIKIEPTNPAHIIELRGNLREGDMCEIQNMGMSIRKALWRSYKRSMICKTAIVENQVAGIWGLEGILLGGVGHPWLLTSPVCEKYPISFALLYRQEIKEMLTIFERLENYVDASYTKSIKLLKLIGFKVGEPQPLGPLNKLFRKYEISVSDV